MVVRVHFDLYTRDDDRWMLHGNFPDSEHAQALNAARGLDAAGAHAGTQVIRVTRFAETRPPIETIEWITPSLADLAPKDPRRRQNRPIIPPPPQLAETPAPTEPNTPETPKFLRSPDPATPRPFPALTIVAAIVIGGAAAGGVFHVARNAVLKISASGHALTAGLSAIVTVVGAMAAFIFVTALVAYLARPRSVAAGVSMPPPPGSARLDHSHRRTMLRFVERLLTRLSASHVPMREKTQFGINLLVAGAGEHYASTIGLGGFDRYVLIHDTLQALGVEADAADQFCQRFYQFDSDPTHRPMTNAGRALFEGFLRAGDESLPELPGVVENWASATT